MGEGMSEPSLGDILKRCGMVESKPGKASMKFNVSYDVPAKWNTTSIREEFPGLEVKITTDNLRPGMPFVVNYEVTGPREQVLAFIAKYGNDNLKEEMGLL